MSDTDFRRSTSMNWSVGPWVVHSPIIHGYLPTVGITLKKAYDHGVKSQYGGVDCIHSRPPQKYVTSASKLSLPQSCNSSNQLHRTPTPEISPQRVTDNEKFISPERKSDVSQSDSSARDLYPWMWGADPVADTWPTRPLHAQNQVPDTFSHLERSGSHQGADAYSPILLQGESL